MGFGQALDKVLDERHETQESIALVTHVSNSLVSKVICGARKPSQDIMQRTIEHYDDPRLYLAAMEEVTGGACTPWLDNADLHKSNVHLKTIEEVNEALVALNRVPITKRKEQLTPEDLIEIREAIMECIEAITALMHDVAVLCKEYTFSWVKLWKEHRQDLKTKQYLR